MDYGRERLTFKGYVVARLRGQSCSKPETAQRSSVAAAAAAVAAAAAAELAEVQAAAVTAAAAAVAVAAAAAAVVAAASVRISLVQQTRGNPLPAAGACRSSSRTSINRDEAAAVVCHSIHF